MRYFNKLLPVFMLACLVLPTLAVAQGRNTEVVIEHSGTAFIKTDVLVRDLDVLSGGVESADAASLMNQIVANDLRLSGLFQVGFSEENPDSLEYEFTIEDPSTFTDKIVAMIPMAKVDGQIYEYACHEGNYGMTNLLRGERMEEVRAAENDQ
jgi:hypothetical protein